jgi:hypothetical protein
MVSAAIGGGPDEGRERGAVAMFPDERGPPVISANMGNMLGS